jgi:methyl-accepting chemotaxis protein
MVSKVGLQTSVDTPIQPAGVVRETPMPNTNLEFLFIIFIGITGFAVLLQAGILLAMFLVVRKAVKIGMERTDEFKEKLTPVLEVSHKFLTTGHDLIDSTRAIVAKIDPRIESTVKEIEKMTQELHSQVTRLQQSVDDVAQKARHHVDRVDGMTTSFLNSVDRAGKFVNQAVDVPVRHAAGIVAAVRAVVETLRIPSERRARRDSHPAPDAPQPAHQAGDKDFVAEPPHRGR